MPPCFNWISLRLRPSHTCCARSSVCVNCRNVCVVCLIAFIAFIAFMGGRAVARRCRLKRPVTASYRLSDLSEQGAWVKLAKKSDEEFVFGLIGKFWQLHYGALAIKAQEFAVFDTPGYAKTACSFGVRPDGAGHSLVTYEVRTATTDATARRWFRWYWRSIALCVVYLMHRGLQAVKAEAEGSAIQHARPSAPAMFGRTA
jgi:hypothetical protein